MIQPLPMSVIAGYLGAGKTTLINRLLVGDHGLKLLILVNDFGAINVDAALLASADEDTIALTNGCVCCTMGADLFMALGDVLDRRPRPDHVLIEASGVADPASIAQAALAEPDLRYGGIVTLVDGISFAALGRDPMIGAQLNTQVAQADMIVVTKRPDLPRDLLDQLAYLSPAPVILADDLHAPDALLLGDPAAPKAGRHGTYASWSQPAPEPMAQADLIARLNARPAGLFRVKGHVPATDDGPHWEVQVVGRQVEVRPAPDDRPIGLVGIGLAAQLDAADLAKWWPDTRKHNA